MPRTMLNDEHWSKLSVIMLKNRVYNKLTHRNTLEGILYRMRTGCPWRDVPDLEWEFIDGSIVKAHQHSTGARTEDDEGIDKSVAGNTTKIHMAVDSYGLLIEFYITGGEVHDSKAAP